MQTFDIFLHQIEDGFLYPLCCYALLLEISAQRQSVYFRRNIVTVMLNSVGLLLFRVTFDMKTELHVTLTPGAKKLL